MKKVLFLMLTIMMFITINSSMIAQITKTEEIFHTSLLFCTINAYKNTETETRILFMAQNAEYTEISDIITLFSGSPEDFYNYLNDVENFFKDNEDGTSTNINGGKTHLSKSKSAWVIFELKEDGNGYYSLMKNRIPKIKESFLVWAKKNGYSFN